MKIVFIGTVTSSYVALEEMLKLGTKIEAVFTMKNNKFNSDYANLVPICKEYNIKVYEIENINDEENIFIIKNIEPDFIFVIGISQIIKKEIISLAKKYCIGLHPSLLPKNRGRAVLGWTILQEEKKTGITLFKIEEGVDSGEIIFQEEILLDKTENIESLSIKILKSLRNIIKLQLKNILEEKIILKKQDEKEATYCAIRTPGDSKINWNDSAKNIEKLIRASSKPYQGAFSYHKRKKIIIWDAEIVKKDNWLGLPGQRVEILKDVGVKVKTGNGLLLLKKISYDHKEMDSWELFKIPGKKFDDEIGGEI
ncbi:MAG: methionyl-tRNA formyltransferase [Fusobacteriaceae bacterium]